MLGTYCRYLLSFGAVSFLLVMIFMELDCPASFPSCPPGPRCCSELQYTAVNSSLGTIVHVVPSDVCMITRCLDFLIPYQLVTWNLLNVVKDKLLFLWSSIVCHALLNFWIFWLASFKPASAGIVFLSSQLEL